VEASLRGPFPSSAAAVLLHFDVIRAEALSMDGNPSALHGWNPHQRVRNQFPDYGLENPYRLIILIDR
jgi:hypothetical protein